MARSGDMNRICILECKNACRDLLFLANLVLFTLVSFKGDERYEN
jgi:hypothetical protein